MSASSHRSRPAPSSRQRGLSLLEVLISLLVMAVGLLGLAMLQVTNLRLTQSANNRTVANNLAYEMMDNIRSNRLNAANYAGDISANGAKTDGCAKLDGSNSAVQKQEFACRMLAALGADASASIGVTVAGNMSRVSIRISWADSNRWRSDGASASITASSNL
ncbi:type IV pilus modification protein PilV [Pseudomonas sp. CGJS7]|uniref:type IV pilus modification protein PilV n=1 Tax=Pseudomonas sp. CGJS7 TaxID=3109348 RepID=UPI0030086BA1